MIRRLLARAVLLPVAIAINGCHHNSAPDFLACDALASLELPASKTDSLPPPDERMVPDAPWAALARSAPGGFAGIYFTQGTDVRQREPGRRRGVVVRLTRPRERTQALAVLLPQLTRTLGGLLVDSSDVTVIPARWDSAQLYDWRRYLDERISVPSVQTLSTDVMANGIRYGVTSAPARITVERRLGELHVPCGLVKVEVEGVARAI